eukprot:Rmarinus@m.3763
MKVLLSLLISLLIVSTVCEKNHTVTLGGLFSYIEHIEVAESCFYSVFGSVECSDVSPTVLSVNDAAKDPLSGFYMAISEINDHEDGVLDDVLSSVDLEFIVLDDLDSFDATWRLIEANVGGIVGPSENEDVFRSAVLSSHYKVAQVSFGATAAPLNNVDYYDAFFRTIPDSKLQGIAIADLISALDWNQVAVLTAIESSGYSHEILQQFLEEAEVLGLTVIADLFVYQNSTNGTSSYHDQLEVLVASGAHLIVLLGDNFPTTDFLYAASEAGVAGEGYTFIGSSGALHDVMMENMNTDPDLLKGFLGFHEPSHAGATPETYDYFKERWQRLADKVPLAEDGCSDETDSAGHFIWRYEIDGEWHCFLPDFASGSFSSRTLYAYDAALTLALAVQGAWNEANEDTCDTDCLSSDKILSKLLETDTVGESGPIRFYADGSSGSTSRAYGSTLDLFNYDGADWRYIGEWENNWGLELCSSGEASVWEDLGCYDIVYSTGDEKPLDRSLPPYLRLGALFPMFVTTEIGPMMDITGVELMSVFKLAVDVINADTTLLPHTEIVYDLRDSRRDSGVALLASYEFIQSFSGYGVDAVIGPVTSGASLDSQLIVQQQGTPQLGFAVSNVELSEKTLYPTFGRTYPAADVGIDALAEMIHEYFQWERVGLVVATDSAGLTNMELFQVAASERDIELLTVQTVPSSVSDVSDQLRVIKSTEARVIVLFADLEVACSVFATAASVGIVGDGYVWILDDRGTTPELTRCLNGLGFNADTVLKGSFGMTPWSGQGSDQYDQLIELWSEQACTGGSPCECSEETDSEGKRIWYQDQDGDGVRDACVGFDFAEAALSPPDAIAYVYDATFAIARAFHYLVNDQARTSVTGAQFLDAIRGIEFEGVTGHVSFTETGDRNGTIVFDLMNHPGDVDGPGGSFRPVVEWTPDDGPRECASTRVCSDIVFSTADNSQPVDWPGCLPGTQTVGDTCVECGMMYYQPAYGQSECVRCPDNMQRGFGTPGTTVEDCECQPGYWFPPETPIEEGCDSCPDGGTCEGSDVMPYPQPGYWGDPENPRKFYRCLFDWRCTGGPTYDCRGGYRNRFCFECDEDHFQLGIECRTCWDTNEEENFIEVLSYGALIVTWTLITVMVAGQYDAIPIGLLYIQIAGTIAKMKLNWPEDFAQGIALLDGVNFDVEYYLPICNIEWKFFYTLIMQLLLPLMAALIYISWHVILTKLKNLLISHVDDDIEKRRDMCIHHIVCFVDVMYLSLTTHSLQPFVCITSPDQGTDWLVASPDIECGSPEHIGLVFLGIVGLLCYTVGLPVFYSYILYRGYVEGTLSHGIYLRRFRFVYSRFEAEYLWWQLVLLLRRILFSMVLVMFHEEPMFQATLGTAVLVVSAALQYYARPFVRNSLDLLESFSLMSLVAFLFSGVLFYDDSFGYHEELEIIIDFLVLLTLFLVFVVCFFNIVERLSALKVASRIYYLKRFTNPVKDVPGIPGPAADDSGTDSGSDAVQTDAEANGGPAGSSADSESVSLKQWKKRVKARASIQLSSPILDNPEMQDMEIKAVRELNNQGFSARMRLMVAAYLEEYSKDQHMGELHRTVAVHQLRRWADAKLTYRAVKLYNSVDGWLSKYVADDSPTSNYVHTPLAEFYRRLADAMPWIVEWLALADEDLHRKAQKILESMVRFYCNKEKIRYEPMVAEEDKSSVVCCLSRGKAKQRQQFCLLLNEIIAAKKQMDPPPHPILKWMKAGLLKHLPPSLRQKPRRDFTTVPGYPALFAESGLHKVKEETGESESESNGPSRKGLGKRSPLGNGARVMKDAGKTEPEGKGRKGNSGPSAETRQLLGVSGKSSSDQNAAEPPTREARSNRSSGSIERVPTSSDSAREPLPEDTTNVRFIPMPRDTPPARPSDIELQVSSRHSSTLSNPRELASLSTPDSVLHDMDGMSTPSPEEEFPNNDRSPLLRR